MISRCNRSCYNCPTCTSFLTVNLLDAPTEEQTNAEVPPGPFILSCGYCNWTSLDIGIKFDKANNITGQLQRIRNGGRVVPTPKERESQAERLLRRVSKDESSLDSRLENQPIEQLAPDADDLFSNLNSFYKSQMDGPTDNLSSPSAINRLLNLYSTGIKTRRPKSKPMRESLSIGEGLKEFDDSTEEERIEKLASEGWDATTSLLQREFQERHAPHFTSDLRPTATLLRTKRSKRCKTCRTLLSRPEPKVTTTRYKIKVLALNNVPKVSLRSLNSTSASLVTSMVTSTTSSQADYISLHPLMPYQFLLTLTNPLFDPIRVTLATPATTPGRVQTRVTILCPQFEVGANTDVWDDALNSGTSQKRKSLMPGMSLTSSTDPDGKQAEAGKVWEKGRNWTSVIVEVVPGVLPGSTGHAAGVGEEKATQLEEDEDVLEVPVFVRLEYETEAGAGEEKRGGEAKEKREVAFWCVLGVGRIVG
jgi:dynactin-4